jgi:hypothetical protein
MSREMIVLGYLILCTIVAILGRNKTIGFWGFFFFSVILTPIIGISILIIAKDRKANLVA